jgi:hypothetical protein
LAAGVVAVFLIRSQLFAYVGDEPFHLVAAQLIYAGKKPYIDFFYQHTPLHAYLIAGLFQLCETWRIAHAFSALALGVSVVLACCYARDLFVEESARRTAVLLTLIFYGANSYALIFATTGLPYGFCLLCSMAALFFSRPNARRLHSFAAGLFAGAAAASNLLTLPLLAVILLRILIRDKWRVLILIAGAGVACLPLLILFAESPSHVWFNLVGYHFVDRPNLGWRFNVGQMITWFGSAQGAILTALAILANLFRRDDEIRWCSWTALALIVLISGVATTSAFYFLLALPFLVVLAAVGAVEASRRAVINRNVVAVLLVALYLLGLFGMKYVWRWQAPYADHREVEMIAQELEACTSTRGSFYAFEAVYFASHRLPPPTLENRFNPNSRADEMLRNGEFDAVCIGPTNPSVSEFRLLERYSTIKTVSLGGYPMYILCDKRP